MGSGDVLKSVADSDDIGWIAASHLWHAFRDLCVLPEAAYGEKFFRLNTGEPHPFANFALLTDLDDANLAREAIAPLVATPTISTVIPVSKQESGPAITAIEELGYSVAEQMPAMAVDIGSLSHTTLGGGYEFVRVTQSERDQWIECLALGYGIPHYTASAFIPAQIAIAESDAVQYFAVMCDGKAVAVSMVYMAHGVAGIYCVATLSEHRGKGLGAFVTAEPLRIAQRLGYRVGVLQSSAMGHSVYKGLGFQDVGQKPIYLRMP